MDEVVAVGRRTRRSVSRGDIGTRDDVERFVRAFYADVLTDDLLGPVFHDLVADWPAHLDKLTDFWSWQLLGEPGYRGNPLRAHESVHPAYPITGARLDRWLELFRSTVLGMFDGPIAELAVRRAEKQAHALRRLVVDDQSQLVPGSGRTPESR